MKRIMTLLLSLLLFSGCSGAADGYKQIDQKTAKDMMDQGGVIVLDVREQDEYDGGHIPGAVLLPVGRSDPQQRGCGAGVLPQRQPQQKSGGGTFCAGLYKDLRIRRYSHLAL